MVAFRSPSAMRSGKGTTADFLPTKDVFRVVVAGVPVAKPMEVRVGNLKVGFFVFPADASSNNDRCFVVSAAVKDVTFV